MAGLARVQQRFTTALVATLAALVNFARGGGDRQAAQRLASHGHPILAKLIKTNPPRKGTPGRAYPGYCAGKQETRRRLFAIRDARYAKLRAENNQV